jgi:hypothetical protein
MRSCGGRPAPIRWKDRERTNPPRRARILDTKKRAWPHADSPTRRDERATEWSFIIEGVNYHAVIAFTLWMEVAVAGQDGKRRAPTLAHPNAPVLTPAWTPATQARPVAPPSARLAAPPPAPVRPSTAQCRSPTSFAARSNIQPPPTKYGPAGAAQTKGAPGSLLQPVHREPPLAAGHAQATKTVVQRAAAAGAGAGVQAILVPQGNYYRGAKANLFTEGIATCVGLYAEIGNGGCFFTHVDQPVGINNEDTLEKINEVVGYIQDIVGAGRIKYMSTPNRTLLSQAIEAAFAGRIDSKMQMDEMLVLANGNVRQGKCDVALIPGDINILTHTQDAERNFYEYGRAYGPNPAAKYAGMPKATPQRFAVKK